MATTKLQEHEGKTGVLHFTDGHTVRARLVHVDPDDRHEVIYDILEVIAPGPPRWAKVKPGTTATAPLTDVAGFEALEGNR
jgi:hypothetical protein